MLPACTTHHSCDRECRVFVQGMRLVCVSGQQGTQDVTQMSFKQATGVFRTAGRPVTLTMSQPDQQAVHPAQSQGPVAAQTQSALERLHELQAQATLIVETGGGTPRENQDAAGDEPSSPNPSWEDGLEIFWHLRMQHMLRKWHEAAQDGLLAAGVPDDTSRTPSEDSSPHSSLAFAPAPELVPTHVGATAPQPSGTSSSGLAASAEEGLPPAQLSLQQGPLIVSCPEGVREGQRLIVTAPDGTDLEIIVPDGVFSGDEFEIQIGE